MPSDKYDPRPEHKFSFGLWTVGNRGRDPFGEAVRPTIPPNDIVALLAEVGAWGVNLHDNDLVPIDATCHERERIVGDFRQALEQHGIVVPMATVNLFFEPVFRDGAFTANDADVRAYALEKTKQAMDLAQVRHDTVERPANSFRISLSDGKVCTTFGIGFQPFWNV